MLQAKFPMLFFFFATPRGKKKQKNMLLPTSLNNAPSQLYVSAGKKKLSPFGGTPDKRIPEGLF